MDYNLKQTSLSVIKQLLEDKPNLKNEEYAQLLGISVRTFQRYISKNLEFDRRAQKYVDYLLKQGYKIEKI